MALRNERVLVTVVRLSGRAGRRKGYKVPETAAIGRAAPGLSAAVADGGLA